MIDPGIKRFRCMRGNRIWAAILASLATLVLIAASAGAAFASPTSPKVLIAEAQCDPSALSATLRGQVLAQPGVAAVDFFDGALATPTVAQLMAYDVVLAMGDCGWSDAVGLGNNLATYQDQGGVVVGATFSWTGAGASTLGGRWIDAAYSPYQVGAAGGFSSTVSLGAHDASSPLLAGVSNLYGYYHDAVSLMPGASEVAKWTDGTSAVAVKGRAVGINTNLGDYSDTPVRWGGDFATIIVNAAPKPSNSFTARLKGKKLRVGVSAPGTVVVSDARAALRASIAKKGRRLLLKSSSRSGGPPAITVPLRLTKPAKSRLRRKGAVKVKAKITFTPQRGVSNTRSVALRLKRRK